MTFPQGPCKSEEKVAMSHCTATVPLYCYWWKLLCKLKTKSGTTKKQHQQQQKSLILGLYHDLFNLLDKICFEMVSFSDGLSHSALKVFHYMITRSIEQYKINQVKAFSWIRFCFITVRTLPLYSLPQWQQLNTVNRSFFKCWCRANHQNEFWWVKQWYIS